MPDKLRANIELGAQIAIAIAVLVMAGVVVKRNLFPGPVNPASLPRIAVGERLNVPQVNWEQNQKSLVFFLMKDCVHCQASAPFYRLLIEEAAKRDVKLLAIPPNPVAEGEAYLKSLELPIEDVQTATLSSYKIPGTPTVLFVDSRGTVRSAWFGSALGREKEMRDQLLPLLDTRVPD